MPGRVGGNVMVHRIDIASRFGCRGVQDPGGGGVRPQYALAPFLAPRRENHFPTSTHAYFGRNKCGRLFMMEVRST
jgi:hypothetical protein